LKLRSARGSLPIERSLEAKSREGRPSFDFSGENRVRISAGRCGGPRSTACVILASAWSEAVDKSQQGRGRETKVLPLARMDLYRSLDPADFSARFAARIEASRNKPG
jgi:hypothetical protein